MIYIYQILKQIRTARQYHANAIAKRLRLSDTQFREYESKFKLIPSSLLSNWLDELDVVPMDHSWYIQRHKREYIYQLLAEHIAVPSDIGNDLIAKMADVLVFYDNIDISSVCTQLQRHTLPHILPRPRSAEIAMDDIKDSDK
tara:strand:+ start:492 stop:920 length:429 start_codon:yes stop_codon:yes gene_type:complete